MNKSQRDKMVHDGGEKTKDAPAKVDTLICGRDCMVPGLGHFQHGEKVTDPRVVEALRGHIYFHPQEVE